MNGSSHFCETLYDNSAHLPSAKKVQATKNAAHEKIQFCPQTPLGSSPPG